MIEAFRVLSWIFLLVLFAVLVQLARHLWRAR